MKKLLVLLTILFLPISVGAEEIRSFVSDITLNTDGSFAVSETIIYDFGSDDRHGIFRFLPTDHFQGSPRRFYERFIEVDVVSVTINGETVPYEINRALNELEIKIGDKNRMINGEHKYVIDYVVTGALSYYDSGEVDLYWNATGDGWEVPIKSALVRVYDPHGITLPNSRCYFGYAGETDECDTSVATSSITFGTVELAPGEGLTIAQEIDRAVVEYQVLERLTIWPLWLIGALLWFVWLTRLLYRYYREYRTGDPIIAQYEPYENFKPMYAGLLQDGRVDPRDITAGIIYLAQQGFLKIKRIGRKKFFFVEVDDYEIELCRRFSELETDFQKKIFTLLFEESAEVGIVLVLSELAKDTTKQKENYKVVTALRAAAEADLIAQGFFEYRWSKPISITLWLGGTLVVLLGTTALMGASMLIPLVISGVVLVLTIILSLFVYRRRTRKGYEASDHLKGFKEFLSVTDKERFKFHNAPKKSPEQFMQYLPYAIAFGVEEEWAKVFKDIAIPEPDWYHGDGTAFNAVYLSQSLGTFGTAITNASGAAPASSGGGSSGGGTGGGGGGSW